MQPIVNARLLIDAIVRQTTVLVAQLSTAAGIRAPLAHVADEVFLSLSREIEAQGVGRKVAADMFGLALRTYQKKVHWLTESATEQSTTLWEAVGAELGWEVAVMDHFRAVANAIAAKLRNGRTRSAPDDVVGGTTLSFRLRPGHPMWGRVHGLLAHVRKEAISLWQEVEADNVAAGASEGDATLVWFYVGQYVESENAEETP